MASIVDIWNTALTHIGHRATIADPDESSVEANHCRRFYPLALSVTLERHAWGFATRRATLAEVPNSAAEWSFAYAVPANCVKVRGVMMPGAGRNDKRNPFVIESNDSGEPVICCDVEDAVARYTYLVSDTSKFTPMFVLALSYDLASMLVGPIPKDIKMKKGMIETAIFYTSQAEAADANASCDDVYAEFIPSSLAAR